MGAIHILRNLTLGAFCDLAPPSGITTIATRDSVTPIDPIVTAATALVNPYTKEGVESLRILPYTSVNVRVVDGQWMKFNAVNGQSPKISVVNRDSQNAEKSWSKF